MADRGFPGPYVHTIKNDDSMMKQVPYDTMDIAGRPNAIPKDKAGEQMRISHVGNKVPSGTPGI
jgi:hypothetical protein